MAVITVQDVVDDASQDVRNLLSSSSTVLINYVDRIQRDIIRRSTYTRLNTATVIIPTINGTASYDTAAAPVNINDLRRISSVYDRTNERLLLPLSEAFAPHVVADVSSQAKQPEILPPVRKRLKFLSEFPEYYDVIGTALYLYPTPKSVQSLEIKYEKTLAEVSSLGTSLIISDDFKDVITAGVNYLGAIYLKLPDEASMWKTIYEGQLKTV